ncbi:hypothetical protein CFP56_006205 [Quercus suber]|uniref:Uncharacterized protein n=1 Tax=Quercus suber TaxID=58331 RepID=A0AAW0IFJ1_QUESU
MQHTHPYCLIADYCWTRFLIPR